MEGFGVTLGAFPTLPNPQVHWSPGDGLSLVLILSFDSYVTLAGYFMSLNLSFFIFKIRRLAWTMSEVPSSATVHLRSHRLVIGIRLDSSTLCDTSKPSELTPEGIPLVPGNSLRCCAFTQRSKIGADYLPWLPGLILHW